MCKRSRNDKFWYLKTKAGVGPSSIEGGGCQWGRCVAWLLGDLKTKNSSFCFISRWRRSTNLILAPSYSAVYSAKYNGSANSESVPCLSPMLNLYRSYDVCQTDSCSNVVLWDRLTLAEDIISVLWWNRLRW